MVNLLTKMTLTEVVLVVFAILLALKELLSVVDYFKNRAKATFDKDYSEKETLDKILSKLEDLDSEAKNRAREIAEMKKDFNDKLDKQEQKLQRLADSDRDDIKGWIVQRHHELIEQGWVDDFSMDVITRRFKHYEAEGGNSYAEDLVKEIAALPKTAPAKK